MGLNSFLEDNGGDIFSKEEGDVQQLHLNLPVSKWSWERMVLQQEFLTLFSLLL